MVRVFLIIAAVAIVLTAHRSASAQVYWGTHFDIIPQTTTHNDYIPHRNHVDVVPHTQRTLTWCRIRTTARFDGLVSFGTRRRTTTTFRTVTTSMLCLIRQLISIEFPDSGLLLHIGLTITTLGMATPCQSYRTCHTIIHRTQSMRRTHP